MTDSEVVAIEVLIPVNVCLRVTGPCKGVVFPVSVRNFQNQVISRIWPPWNLKDLLDFLMVPPYPLN